MPPWMGTRALSASSSVSPPNSSHAFRQLLVEITPKGLLVSRVGESAEGPALLVNWGRDGAVEKAEYSDGGSENRIIVEGGIVGLLRGFHDSFLILVVESSVAATLEDPPRAILSVSKLLSIPLELKRARDALAPYRTMGKAKVDSPSSVSSDGGVTDDDSDLDGTDEGEAEGLRELGLGPAIAASVVANEGGISTPARRKLWDRLSFAPRTPPRSLVASTSTPGSASSSTMTLPADPITPPNPASILPDPPRPPTPDEIELATSRKLLDTKILRELLVILGEGMYFSFDFDITTSLQHKHEIITASRATSDTPKSTLKRASVEKEEERAGLIEPLSHLPLWRRADKRFWFNEHLMQDFVRIGASSYIIVLQQGFVKQATVHLPLQSYATFPSFLQPTEPPSPSSVALSFLLISRRSVERPGFRYQRRGASAEGSVANFVESEFIVIAQRAAKQHVASFVQTRGSIPVFWSQSPWALKPPPVLERTPDERLAALTNHFTSQVKLYGKQIIVNLAEKTGKEAAVVDAYRDGVAKMGKKEEVKYVEFDFHAQCKGMHYENIHRLTDEIEADLESLQYFWTTGDDVFTSQQGVVRTNCIDCLDRTNVVQSAISRWALNRHLVHLGITTQEEAGQHDELDACFNNIWADNGDAISREYAGTSALKGDFTRTGKRDLRGQINDATNSMARLLRSTTSDFFRQAVVDYSLGRNLNAFVEFQANLISSDPGSLLEIQKIRAEAIETSTLMLLQDGEELMIGWTLLSPQEPDVVRSTKFIERVLLLSSRAIYCVEYEYTLQKVVSYTRIPTGDVLGFQVGPYVLSALDGAGRDPIENYGFLLKFDGQAALDRVATASMRVKTSPRLSVSKSGQPTRLSLDPGSSHFFAFRAIRGSAGGVEESGKSRTAMDVVDDIVSILTDACENAGAVEAGDESWIVKKPIVSLEQAQAQTPYLDRLQHSLKALIWL